MQIYFIFSHTTTIIIWINKAKRSNEKEKKGKKSHLYSRLLFWLISINTQCVKKKLEKMSKVGGSWLDEWDAFEDC